MDEKHRGNGLTRILGQVDIGQGLHASSARAPVHEPLVGRCRRLKVVRRNQGPEITENRPFAGGGPGNSALFFRSVNHGGIVITEHPMSKQTLFGPLITIDLDGVEEEGVVPSHLEEEKFRVAPSKRLSQSLASGFSCGSKNGKIPHLQLLMGQNNLR